jgi:MYXO-CTERM domain-containing protein
MVQLQSDSSVRGLYSDDQGRLWFKGWSDGYNTVFPMKYWNPKEKNPFLNEACFPNTCIYPHGARSYGMVARLLDSYNEVARATWWASFEESQRAGAKKPPEGVLAWLEAQPTCGCKDSNIVWPTSSSFSGIRFFGNEAIIYGGGDKYPPTTPDAWFGRQTDGSQFVGILDQDLTRARFAATIPASRGHIALDVRGGRLVLGTAVGAAFKPMSSQPLQATFGGGITDALLLVSCIGDPAACDGPMPALPAAARPPVVKPEPPLPTLARCDPKTGTSTITSGALPDFGVDYSRAPTTNAAADAGAAPSTPRPAGGMDAGVPPPGDPPRGGAGAAGAPPAGGNTGASGAGAGASGHSAAKPTGGGCQVSAAPSGGPAAVLMAALLLRRRRPRSR